MASKRKFYAVAAGRQPGIYDTWAECEHQIKGFKGQKFKSFLSKAEAEEFLNESRHERVQLSYAGPSSVVTKSQAPVACSTNPFQAFNHHSSVLEMAVTDYELRVESRSVSQTSGVAVPPPPPPAPAYLTDDGTMVSDDQAMYQLEYDGASKGNPGIAGAGALLRHLDGTVVKEISVGLGTATNNVAEYRGLIAGLREALELGISRIRVQGDSKLVTMQVRGKWKINNPTLAILCKEAIALVKNFREFQIRHVDREWNAPADALANKGVFLPEEKFVSTFFDLE